jgi:RimJ/RimL family protein N-acetyltransferase
VTDGEFVPAGFEPPHRLTAPGMELEPLGPQHNESDYAAWTSSKEHIRTTPGFAGGTWPREMTLDENRADLERHARDFAERRGFTYTVREPGDGEVIGCVYIYPLDGTTDVASVSSWVRADRAELDAPLHRAVTEWLERDWPFPRFEYAPR